MRASPGRGRRTAPSSLLQKFKLGPDLLAWFFSFSLWRLPVLRTCARKCALTVLSLALSRTYHERNRYVLSNVASVPNPFIDDSPVSEAGIAVDIVVSLYAMVCISCITGIAASFDHVQTIPDQFNLHTKRAAAFAILLGIPLGIIAVCCILGYIMALCEGWSWWTGFLYVSSVSETKEGLNFISSPAKPIFP